MKHYENKQALLDTINETYHAYISEFAGILEAQKDQHVEEGDKTPAENLSYQLGWLKLLLSWDRDELAGEVVHTPAVGYKWNNLGGLYQTFYDEYDSYTLKTKIEMLNSTVSDLVNWIESLTEEELFETKQRKWATTKAEWPLWKWIHINTVAPFTSFRSKIRRWKKGSMEYG